MYFTKLPLLLLILYLGYVLTEDNDTLAENHRKERVNGRIVKLYSGSKPDPILCHKEGFQADVDDCSIFYRCLKAHNEKYTVFRFQCAPGTVYDPEKELCNYPQNTRRSNCGVSNGLNVEERHDNEIDAVQQELPRPIKTTEVPQNSINLHEPSPPGHYNDILSNYPPIVFNNYNNITTLSPSDILQANKVMQSTNTQNGNNQEGDLCYSQGFMGDTKNCKKFYRCVSNLRGGFIRYEFLCSDATIWDDTTQGCNHAWLARNTRCGRVNTYMENIDRFGDKKPKENVAVNVYNEPKPQINHEPTSNQIKPQDDNNILLNQAYVELPQRTTIKSTTTSNVPVYLNYGDKIYQPDYSPSHPASNKNETDINKTEYNDFEETNKINNKNYDDRCHQSGFFGYRNNCNKFYRCVANSRGSYTKYEFSCSEGTVWDDKLKACNFAWAVKECGSKNLLDNRVISTTELYNYDIHNTLATASEVDISYGVNNEGSPASLIGSSNTPGAFISSTMRTTTVSTTTTVNDIMDYDSGYQQQSQNRNTDSTTEVINNILNKPLKTLQNKCTKSGFMGDTNDCSKFYRCVDSGRGTFIQYEFSCGEGTVWDSRIESCNHAWAVEKCGQNSKGSDYISETTMTTRPTTVDNGIVYTTYGYNELNKLNSTTFDYTTEKVTSLKENNNLIYSTLQPNANTQFSYNADMISAESRGSCVKEGFYPYPEDCKKFYRCVNNGMGGYEKYDFNCGEGTAWDVKINSCNHIENVKSCHKSQEDEKDIEYKPIIQDDQTLEGTTISTSTTNIPSTDTVKPTGTQSVGTMKPASDNICTAPGYVGDVNDCKKFYRCVDDGKNGYIKYEYTCGEGTMWDQDITSCNHPQDVKNPSCLPGGSKSSTTSITTPSLPSTTTNPANTDSSSKSPPVTDELSSEQGFITSSTSLRPSSIDTKQTCNEEGFFGDSTDCKKFYRCVNNGKDGFIKYDFTCGEGTIWDQDIVACNYPTDVSTPSCSFENVESSKTTTMKSSSSSGFTTESQQNQQTSDKDNWSTTVNNIKQSSTTQRVPQTESSTEYTKPNNEDSCSAEGFFGSSRDCKQFYRCVYNGKDGYTQYVFSCGEGTIWDQDIVACNHPTDVKNPSCAGQDTSQTMTEASSTSTSYSTESTMTTSSSSSQTKTTEDNSWTSTSSSVTTKPSTQNTKPNNVDSCSNEGFFGSSDDCKKFYRCVYDGKDGFIRYDFSCGEGTIWDQEITACNHPRDVANPSCLMEDTNVSSTTAKDFPSSTDSTASSTIPQSSSTTTSTSANTDNGVSENNENDGTSTQQEKGNFTCTKAGFYPNPTDCKKFYRCVDWNNDGSSFSIFHFECGEGTIWDPTLDTCNHEDSVYPSRNCSGSESQTSNNTENPPVEITTSDSTSTTTEEIKTTTQQPTTSKQTTTQEVTSSESTTMQQTTDVATTNSQQTTSTEKLTTESTTSSTDQSTTTTQQTTSQEITSSESTTTQQSTSTDSTSTTTQATASTEKSTTESTTSSTDQSTSSTSSNQETTTTDRSTTVTDQSTQPDKTTESTTSEATTQMSTTEQQPTSTTEATENDKSTTEASQSTTGSNSASNNKCPDMDENQNAYVCPTSFRRHPKYCNIFYQCTEDDNSHDLKIALFHCPNDTIYDESKTQCLNESKSEKKCEGTKAQTHRIKRLSGDFIDPVTVDKKSYACPGTGYFAFEADQECSPAFLKCQRSRSNKYKGYVFKCPKGYAFWTVSKRCERMSRVMDCKQSSYPWNNRHDIPTEIRNVAP